MRLITITFYINMLGDEIGVTRLISYPINSGGYGDFEIDWVVSHRSFSQIRFCPVFS